VSRCVPRRVTAPWGSAPSVGALHSTEYVGTGRVTTREEAARTLRCSGNETSHLPRFLRLLLKAARCGYYRPCRGAHERQLLTHRERGSLVIYAFSTTQEGLFGFRPFPELWVGRLASACPGECALQGPLARCESQSLTRLLTHHNYHL